MGNLENGLAQMRKTSMLLVFGLLVVVAFLAAMIYGLGALKRGQIEKNQAYAQQTLHTVNQALATYSDRHGGYPDTLKRLGGVEDPGAGSAKVGPPERARLLLPRMAEDSFVVSGFRIRYQSAQLSFRYAATVRLCNSYRLTAEPITPGGSGEWFYYTDQTRLVRGREGEAAGPDDPPL